MNLEVFAYQAVPPTNPGSAPVPSEGGGAAAPPSGDMGSSTLFMFLMFVPLILLLFWQTRSQQKKQEQAVAGLKKGDRVATQSGLIGRLSEIDTRYAKLEIAPGVKVQVLRSSLAGRDAEDSAKGTTDDKSVEKKDKEKDK